eukprot:CAMPEP_0172682520 /NCGR_PEP_ID=MMETSP1074-20121228/18226_1 /TAXON_ID=2916 /ORGANISM="Ceratium fusus, Strain PA161109" /LENGTH=127 /DNA_ID=CAMNT_0013501217 /DNA_START=27 /DNA_END=410 /DNA_ORIENTATION=+
MTSGTTIQANIGPIAAPTRCGFGMAALVFAVHVFESTGKVVHLAQGSGFIAAFAIKLPSGILWKVALMQRITLETLPVLPPGPPAASAGGSDAAPNKTNHSKACGKKRQAEEPPLHVKGDIPRLHLQ